MNQKLFHVTQSSTLLDGIHIDEQFKEKHPLEEIYWGVMSVCTYKGVRVEKIIVGYRVLGQTCIKPEGVDLIIQNACNIISESIAKSETITINAANGSFNAQNDTDGTHVWER